MRCLSVCCYQYEACLKKLQVPDEELPPLTEIFSGPPEPWDYTMRPWIELNEGQNYRRVDIVDLTVRSSPSRPCLV